MRTGCYFDGFNIYHAIDALGDHALKWVNLRSLALSYLKKGETLERAAFFTALNTWDKGKRQRHVAYVKALEAVGVTVVLSHFDKVEKRCYTHDRWCKLREEKQTDVAFATTVLTDCYESNLDRVVLFTADSDQIPTVAAVKRRFPAISVYLVAPPKRLAIARQLGQACDGIAELTAGRLRQHLLPDDLRDDRGRLVAAKPSLYGGR